MRASVVIEVESDRAPGASMTDSQIVDSQDIAAAPHASGRPVTGGGKSLPSVPYETFGIHRPALSYFSIFDGFREQAPAYRLDITPENRGWMLTRFEEIREAFQRPKTFSSSAVIPSAPEPTYKLIPEMIDPPEHTAWRKALGAIFGPKAVEQFDPWVRERAVSLVEGLADRGACEFVVEFAQQFPNSVFLDILGLPQAELPFFVSSVDKIMHGNHSDPADAQRSADTMLEVSQYFSELVAQRRKSPKDDLISTAIGFELDGKSPTDADLLSLLVFLFIAGLDTVAIQLSYSFLHLATHPADQQRVVADPTSIPGYVEDLLRVYSFVSPARKVMHDIDFNGCPIKAGEMVYLPLSAANRDAREFPSPQTVDADRINNRHIAFGAGPHRCLGSHLARRELRIALEEWHRRIPSYAVDEGAVLMESGQQIGLINLPLHWTA
jgi:cytochrome P450